MHRKLVILLAAVLIFVAGAILGTHLETVHGKSQPGTVLPLFPEAKADGI